MVSLELHVSFSIYVLLLLLIITSIMIIILIPLILILIILATIEAGFQTTSLALFQKPTAVCQNLYTHCKSSRNSVFHLSA